MNDTDGRTRQMLIVSRFRRVASVWI